MAKGSKGDGREGREWRKYILLRKNSKHKIKPKMCFQIAIVCKYKHSEVYV